MRGIIMTEETKLPNLIIEENELQKEETKLQKLIAEINMAQKEKFKNDPKGFAQYLQDTFFSWVNLKSVEIVKWLIEEQDIDVNKPNQAGQYALQRAVTSNSPEIVRLLVENGADVNICDVRGASLLELAAEKSFESINILIENGFNIDIIKENPLSLMVNSLYFTFFNEENLLSLDRVMSDVVKLLITKNIEVNLPNSEENILKEVIIKGLTKTAKILIENGAKLDLTNTGKNYIYVSEELIEDLCKTASKQLEYRQAEYVADEPEQKALTAEFACKNIINFLTDYNAALIELQKRSDIPNAEIIDLTFLQESYELVTSLPLLTVNEIEEDNMVLETTPNLLGAVIQEN